MYPQYKFFIAIGYSWSNERDFQDPGQFPEEPGVYRLKAGSEIVRIGESRNIAERLRENLKDYGSEIETFDFEIVPNEAERGEEQKQLLNSFKTAVGRLPKYNPITS